MFFSAEVEIDRLVYSLYGHTREEIAIIEQSLQESVTGQEVTDTLTLDHET